MMLAAGLSATVASLGRVFRKVWLVILVLVVNFVLVPLLGWGIAELFALTTPAFIALVLVACSPGSALRSQDRGHVGGRRRHRQFPADRHGGAR